MSQYRKNSGKLAHRPKTARHGLLYLQKPPCFQPLFASKTRIMPKKSNTSLTFLPAAAPLSLPEVYPPRRAARRGAAMFRRRSRLSIGWRPPGSSGWSRVSSPTLIKCAKRNQMRGNSPRAKRAGYSTPYFVVPCDKHPRPQNPNYRAKSVISIIFRHDAQQCALFPNQCFT